MRASPFTEEQIIGTLKEQKAGAKTADVCRKHGIPSATIYKFKAKHGGMDVSDARWLKALEEENTRLNKLLAEQLLDNAILRDVSSKTMVTRDARRKAVAHVCIAQEVRHRRSCRALGWRSKQRALSEHSSR